MPCRLNGGSSSARVKTVRLRPAGFDGRSLFTAGRSDCLNSGNSTRRDGSRVCCFVLRNIVSGLICLCFASPHWI